MEKSSVFSKACRWCLVEQIALRVLIEIIELENGFKKILFHYKHKQKQTNKTVDRRPKWLNEISSKLVRTANFAKYSDTLFNEALK